MACASLGTTSVTSQGSLKPGSSKHGNAVRASMASNCVNAYGTPACWVLYRPSSALLKGAS
jgi:hypothetical protein